MITVSLVSRQFSFDNVCSDHISSVLIEPRSHHHQGTNSQFPERYYSANDSVVWWYWITPQYQLNTTLQSVTSLRLETTIEEHTLYIGTNTGNNPIGVSNDLWPVLFWKQKSGGTSAEGANIEYRGAKGADGGGVWEGRCGEGSGKGVVPPYMFSF